MRTSDFDYDLPAELIAQQPVEPRDAARLLFVSRDSGALSHHHVRDLPALLRAGDLLVLNDTRVMAARLLGVRADTGGRVELLLLREHDDGAWSALVRPGRAATPGREYRLEASDGPVTATVRCREEEIATVTLDRPIDPASRRNRPPPALHPRVRGRPRALPDSLRPRGAQRRRPHGRPPTSPPTSSEGSTRRGSSAPSSRSRSAPETFRPVRTEDPAEHVLPPERYRLPPAIRPDAIRTARAEGRRVIATGTTVVRTLEHALGGVEGAPEGETALFIRPGHTFTAVDGLLTNFHLPRSTLLMLVSAFAGHDLMRAAYIEAIRERYRFYSFGDAMLILP